MAARHLPRSMVRGERRKPRDRDRPPSVARPALPDRHGLERPLRSAAISASSRTHAASRWRGAHARVGDRAEHVAGDAGHRAAQRAPSVERDLDLDGAGSSRRSSSASAAATMASTIGRTRSMTGRRARPAAASRERSRPRRTRRGRAGEPAVEQPLPDAPFSQRVELDRQRVADLVGVVADVIPSRWRRKARTGCSTKLTRSSSSTIGPLARRQRRVEEGAGASPSVVERTAPRA